MMQLKFDCDGIQSNRALQPTSRGPQSDTSKAKAKANLKKHGVDFREVATVFDDPLSVAFPNADHSWGERRFLIIGASALGRILESWRTWK